MTLYKLETWVEAQDHLKPGEVVSMLANANSLLAKMGKVGQPGPNSYNVAAPKVRITRLAQRSTTT